MLAIRDCLKDIPEWAVQSFTNDVIHGATKEVKTFRLNYKDIQYSFDCCIDNKGGLFVKSFSKQEYSGLSVNIGMLEYSQLELTDEIKEKVVKLKEYAKQLGFVIMDVNTHKPQPDWALNHFI